MVKDGPVILQVVGYQNSGKTTLVKKLVSELSAKNYRTVTIKHHGHGGKPGVLEGKDSTAHLHAGAVATVVEGDGGLLLQADKEAWELEDQLRLLHPFHPDVVLIEGHKQAKYPKVVIIRSREDQSLLALSNIIAVVTCDHSAEVLSSDSPVEVFTRTEQKVIPFLLGYIIRQLR